MINIISISAICLIGLSFAFFIISSLRQKESQRPMGIYFACVFASFVLLNLLSYSAENADLSWFYKLGAAVGTTFNMFGQGYDGSKNAVLADNFLYSLAVTICYFGATSCMALAVLQLFFKGVKNNISVYVNAKAFNGSPIIIAGFGDETRLLLKSMTDEEKRRVTIILGAENNELKEECFSQKIAVINAEVNEKSLAKAGLYNTGKSGAIFISLLGDDEANLASARAVINGMQKYKKTDFSAYIMYHEIERAEHFKFSEKAEGRLSFFNPHEKIARDFLARWPLSSLIPKSFIGEASLKKPYKISHVFAGFGKTNFQLLKKSIIINQLPGCDYNALAIDLNIDDSCAAFKNSARGLFRSAYSADEATQFFPAPAEGYNIEFAALNAHAKEFYERTINVVKESDFTAVVVSLGDDKLSAETAMEIRQWAYENDIAEERIRIFVRMKKRSAMAGDDVLNPETDGIRIEAFGFDEDILSYVSLTDVDTDMLAKHIATHYAGGGTGADWGKIINHERESNRYAALSIRPKLNLIGFDLVFDDLPQDEGVLTEFIAKYESKDIRDALAHYEHQRWNSFYLVSGWQPMPKSEVTATSRKNTRKRKHACITTFEGLYELAKMQAEYGAEFKNTADYDYDLMDNLVKNLEGTKYRIVKM